MLQPIMSLVTEDVKEFIAAHDEEICKLIRELGGTQRSYARERAGAIKAMVAEIYSPPRVTSCAKLLPGYKVIPGFALDLTTTNCKGEAWDFNDPAKRKEARHLVMKEKQLLLALSPMCTAFSRWQNLNAHKRDKELIEREWSQAMVHLKFACELMELQRSAGRYFLCEHPLATSSWNQACVQEVMRKPDVTWVHGDQCNMVSKVEEKTP